MRRHVTESLQHRERKIWRWCLEGEAFADQAGERRRMIERIQAGQDPTGAMPQQKYGKARVSRFHHVHERRDIAHVVGELVDVEPFAVGPATSTEVYGIRGVAHGRESLSHPGVVPAVRIETGHDYDGSACGRRGPPRPKEDLESLVFERFFACRTRQTAFHGILLAAPAACARFRACELSLAVNPFPDV